MAKLTNAELAAKVEEILASMSLEDKAGQMFHAMAFVGDPTVASPMTGEITERMIRELRISHFNAVATAPTAEAFAEWHNQLQEIACDAGFKVPITISTDPRHAFADNPGAAMRAGIFSEWPETMGLAAIGDPETVREFADIARQEYISVGLRAALHPQIDLATEPRWARGGATFGESAELTSKLVGPYIRGFQGEELSATSVSTMTKHFPGGGPQKDGEDPHFPYGKEQVYPGNNFDYHLEPFKAAIAAGTAQMMPYYGQPIALNVNGEKIEEVAFGFNKQIITDLLRNKLGFDGVVCTDWGIINEHPIMGDMWEARAWGLEHLSPKERLVRAIEAGVDQFGGEFCTDLLVEAVRDGLISEDRIDVSVRRLIKQKIHLGLFDNAMVDPAEAAKIVGRADFREAGFRAQQRSIVVLQNNQIAGVAVLPLAGAPKLYVEGIDAEAAAKYGVVVATPEEADFAILRVKAPFEPRPKAFESFFHAGSLDFTDEAREHLLSVAAKVPTILDVYMDRPAILTPLIDAIPAIVANFGARPEALLDVLFGRVKSEAKLPFELPRSMAAVVASRSDMPFDTENPIFKFGHGLSI